MSQNKMSSPPIPIYRKAKTISDLDETMAQLIMILNHNITSICKDLKFVKKFVGVCTGIFTLILVAAICDIFGWVA